MTGYTTHNRIKLVRSGNEYFQTFERLVATASESVYFQTYIFEEDKTGYQVANALMNASRLGIKVFLLLDGYASQNLSHSFIQGMKDSGIFFRWFSQPFRSKNFYFGRRLHHKVLVVDAQHCLIGGINVCDRYNDVDGSQAWLDWAVYVEGEVAWPVFNVCARRALSPWNGSGKFRFPVLHPVHTVNEECRVRMIVNDWVRGKREISNSYLEMFKQSRQDIIIMSSYFLPGSDFRKGLRNAARRNVRIRVILTQVSDVRLAKWAERFLYHWLFKHNVEIYEYPKTILHGKIAVCDRKWVSVGSYNLNELSAKASVEMNLEVTDERFANQVHETLDKIIQSDCMRITQQEFTSHLRWFESLWQRIAYRISRILLFVFTFYFRQRRN